MTTKKPEIERDEVTVPKSVLERYVAEMGTNHAHNIDGVWDWDNGDRAFTACQRCADVRVLQACLDGKEYVMRP